MFENKSNEKEYHTILIFGTELQINEYTIRLFCPVR